MNKTLLFSFIFLFISTLSIAQISFEATASKSEIEFGERVRISFTLSLEGKNMRTSSQSISLPDFEDFEILHRSFSESSQYINGNASKQITQQIILLPTKTGNLKINPASITVDGKTYKTKTLKIKVVGEAPKNNSPRNTNKNPQIQAPNPETFVDFEIDNSNPYFNESIYGELVLYTKNYTLLNRINTIHPPNLKGVTAIPLDSKKKVEQVEKNGDIYIKAVLNEYVIYPIRTGKLEIPAFDVGVIENINFFNQEEVKISSKPTIIKVKELPTNKPNNFSGAVGNFSVNISSDKTKLSTNSSLNVEVEVIGNGNFKLLKTPKLKTSNDLEIYSPKYRDAYQATRSGLKGKIASNTVIVPNYGGNYSITTEPFSYFDPQEKTYKTIKSKEISIHVDGKPKPKPKKIIASKVSKNINSTSDNSNLDSISDSKSEDNNFDLSPFISPEIASNSTNSNWYLYVISTLLIASSIFGFIWYKKREKSINEESDSETSNYVTTAEIKKNKTEEKQAEIVIPTYNFNSDIDELNRLSVNNESKEYFSLLEKTLNKIANTTNSFDSLGELKQKMNQKYGESDAEYWNELIAKCQTEKYAPITDNSVNLIDFHSKIKEKLTTWI
ncbi:MAG: protein BatD [Flavobacteriales bacterium]|nr:protein BatD [Flavobacteriales bacterium]